MYVKTTLLRKTLTLWSFPSSGSRHLQHLLITRSKLLHASAFKFPFCLPLLHANVSTCTRWKIEVLRTKNSAMMASHYIQCFKFCSQGLGNAFVRCSASQGQQQDLRRMTTVWKKFEPCSRKKARIKLLAQKGTRQIACAKSSTTWHLRWDQKPWIVCYRHANTKSVSNAQSALYLKIEIRR